MFRNFGGIIWLAGICMISVIFSGCVPAGTGGGASAQANAMADQKLYQPVEYMNSSKKGPVLIVLPGQIKCTNATFIQRITANNIADFAELELANASFRVLERSDLGPMLDEIAFAVNMGDPTALERFKRGKLKSTQWFVKFDVLRSEQVAKASQGVDLGALGSIAGALVGGTAGSVSSTVGHSTRFGESAGVWIVGLRYKIVDASTTEQVAQGYVEEKMEVGANSGRILGISSSNESGITLDNVVHRVVQKAVVEIDKKK